MRPGRCGDKIPQIEGIEGFAALLKQAKLEFGAEDLLDALWLAGQMGEREGSRREPTPQQAAAATVPPIREEVIEDIDETDADEADLAQFVLPPSDSQAKPETTQPEGLSVKTPAAPALRIQLDLARALRPLRRTVPAPGRLEFDEAATVQQIADQKIWSPVLRPAPERWLDLALVVEGSPSLLLWKGYCSGLKRLEDCPVTSEV